MVSSARARVDFWRDTSTFPFVGSGELAAAWLLA